MGDEASGGIVLASECTGLRHRNWVYCAACDWTWIVSSPLRRDASASPRFGCPHCMILLATLRGASPLVIERGLRGRLLRP
jgi:hypothetical protein